MTDRRVPHPPRPPSQHAPRRAAKNTTERVPPAPTSSGDGCDETLSMDVCRQPDDPDARATTEQQDDDDDDCQASVPMDEEVADVHQHQHVHHRAEMTRAQVGPSGSTIPEPVCEGDTLPADVERVRNRIRTAYKQNKMKLGLGVSSCGTLKSVEKVFVNLVMLPGSAVSREFRDCAGYGSSRDLERVEHVYGRAAREMASVDLADLFNVEVSDDLAGLRTSIRILVLASGGCGKTMVFLKYAPQQWAFGRLWQQFSIVVAREFRSPDVQSAKSAIELLGLQTHGAVTQNSILNLDDYIHAHPEKICLILDGFDEVSLKECSGYLGEVVRGEALEGINLVMTSRPSVDVFDLCKVNPFNRHIEVIGFRREQIGDYVHKVLPANLADKLLDVVDREPQLESMMATPFYTSSICELHQAGYALPKCLTDVFEGLVQRALSRWKKCFYTRWENVPRVAQELVHEVGSFAMQMLFRRRLVFTKEDLEAYNVSEAAMRLGLLVTCEVTPLDMTQQFRFSHLTLQESLASKFVAACDYITGDFIEWLVQKLGGLTGHLNTFWILLAARLNDEQMEVLVSSLLKSHESRESSVEDVEAVTDHFFTHQSPTNRPSIGSARSQRLSAKGRLQGFSRSQPVSSSATTGSIGDTELNQELVLLVIHCFAERALRRPEKKCVAVASLRAALSRQGLDLGSRRLSLADCRAISNVLVCHHKAVEVLNLRDCSIDDQKFTMLSTGLQACQDVKSMDWCFNDLTVSSTDILCDVIRNCSGALEKVNIDGNEIGDEAIGVLHHSLVLCSKLRSLCLGSRGLTHASARLLGDVIGKCTQLGDISVGSENFGDDGFQQLVPSLSSHAIQELDFGDCGLSGECCDALARVVHAQQDHLTHVFLYENAIGDDGLLRLYPSLCQCGKMVHFDMDANGLSSASLPVLTDLLRHWPLVRKLGLRGQEAEEPCPDDTAAALHARTAFTAAVRDCTHLCELWISRDWIDGEEMATIRPGHLECNFDYSDDVDESDDIAESDDAAEIDDVNESDDIDESDDVNVSDDIDKDDGVGGDYSTSTSPNSPTPALSSACLVSGVQSQLPLLPPEYGTKQLGAVDVRKLDEEVGPYLERTSQTVFARWAVQAVDPSKTGVEHNVLGRHLSYHGDALRGCNWDSFLCVLHYLSYQPRGPDLNTVFAKLAEICPPYCQRFLDALSNDQFYTSSN